LIQVNAGQYVAEGEDGRLESGIMPIFAAPPFLSVQLIRHLEAPTLLIIGVH
jgi:hypothetical protein